MINACSQGHALSDQLPDLLLEALLVALELDGGVDVGRGLEVGIEYHGLDAEEHVLDGEHGPPLLYQLLLGVEDVLLGGMQNRDADLSVLVDVGVPHLGGENHGRRGVRVVVWEVQHCLEQPPLVNRVRRPFHAHPPLKQVVVLQPHTERVLTL
jgi:hypothetical protein